MFRFDNNLLEKRPDTYIRQAPMFAFVARKYATGCDNACHVFAELDPDQPASAVVRFITVRRFSLCKYALLPFRTS